MSLRERILDYLEKYPSVGLLRLALDMAPPELLPGGGDWARHVEEVKRAVGELEKLGLVEYKEDVGVVNLRVFREVGWAYAGGSPGWASGEEPEAAPEAHARPKRKAATLESFLGGGGGG